eukprot:9469268-Pyramimonas_sp.AAC.1
MAQRVDPGKAARAKPDLPIGPRMEQSALFGIRRTLTQWGCNKTCVKINADCSPSELSVAGATVVKAAVTDYDVKLHWVDKDWR